MAYLDPQDTSPLVGSMAFHLTLQINIVTHIHIKCQALVSTVFFFENKWRIWNGHISSSTYKNIIYCWNKTVPNIFKSENEVGNVCFWFLVFFIISATGSDHCSQEQNNWLFYYPNEKWRSKTQKCSVNNFKTTLVLKFCDFQQSSQEKTSVFFQL